jgi:AraC-like DNA-binding protein/quercetin dioxygenase-like cupin family protein
LKGSTRASVRKKAPIRLITGASFDYPGGTLVDPHSHGTHQLIYAARGVMSVHTDRGAWVVPPNRALWVPARAQHAIRTIGAVSMRTLYVDTAVRTDLPRDYAVVAVPGLLKELILRLIAVQARESNDRREAHIVAVLLDELQELEVQPLYVPLPEDRRLRALCNAIRSDPGSNRTTAEWGGKFGMSAKTLERSFARDVGMTFGQWRQQVRLLASLERLAAGEPVTSVALDLGYKSPSSFSVMFQRALGSSPSKYFS